jgi:hypothetical protein
MKTQILMAVAGAFCAVATAQTAPELDPVRITAPSTQIELPPQLRNMWTDEFDQIKGTYYLSNGKTMQLSMWGNRMYAKIDGMQKTQLVAASPYVFVALDKRMKIMVEDPDSDSSAIHATVLVSMPLLSDAASRNELITLMARR